MTENKTPAIWKWAIIFLVLCNIGLMLTIWLLPRLNRPQHESPRDFVIRSLQFNEQQVRQYDSLIRLHRQVMNRQEDEARECRNAFFGRLSDPHANPDSLAGLVAANQKQIVITTYRHLAAVRALCTDAQKAAFDRIIEELLRRMHGDGPHQRPGQQGPPPPPPGDGPPPPGAQ